MNSQTYRRWARPASILFATELPANERVFGFALAEARNAGARLVIFHAYDTLVVSASDTSGVRYYDFAAAARTEMKHLEPLAERARAVGVECEIVVTGASRPIDLITPATSVDRMSWARAAPARSARFSSAPSLKRSYGSPKFRCARSAQRL
jgi:hypothetical protein